MTGILLTVAVVERSSLLSDGVIGEEGIGGESDKGNGVMNECNNSTNRVTSTVLTVNGVVWEGVCW